MLDVFRLGGLRIMTEKRFEVETSENQDTIFDNEGPDDYYHLGNDTEDVQALCKLLNELHEENQQLKKTLRIIADAKSVRTENSVKEILRNNLFGLDTVAEESFNAYKEYTLLNNFFKDYYNEYWDNDKYD